MERSAGLDASFELHSILSDLSRGLVQHVQKEEVPLDGESGICTDRYRLSSIPYDVWVEMRPSGQTVEEEIAELRAALEFYADSSSYEKGEIYNVDEHGADHRPSKIKKDGRKGIPLHERVKDGVYDNSSSDRRERWAGGRVVSAIPREEVEDSASETAFSWGTFPGLKEIA